MGAEGLARLEERTASTATPEVAEPADPFWDSYGLLSNPFPPNRTIIREVIYNQITQYDRFATLVGQILESSPTRRALAIVAGTGGGKTHFLHYCQWTFEQIVCDMRKRKFVIVEVVAGASTTLDLVRAILTEADAFCKKEGFAGLGAALVMKASEQGVEILNEAKVDDVRSALEHLSSVIANNAPPDPRQVYTPEVLLELFGRWLQGSNLSETQRKYLGVVARLNTGPVAVRALTDLLHLARELGLIEGVFLSIDEMESLFGGAIRSSQYQSFLQDLRFLYDQAVQGSRGYSLLILTTATTFGADSLRDAIFPLYQRLSYEGTGRVQLAPIGGPDEAREFANVFINYARQEWVKRNPSRSPAREANVLLSDTELKAAYRETAAKASSDRGEPVSQGPLLDALWRAANAARDRTVAAGARTG